MIYGNEGIYTLMALPETGFYIAIRRKVVYDKVRIPAVHKVKQSGIITEMRQVCSGQNWIKEQRTMGHFYFVRHSQTIWNVEGKICGATDIALTDLGLKKISRKKSVKYIGVTAVKNIGHQRESKV